MNAQARSSPDALLGEELQSRFGNPRYCGSILSSLSSLVVKIKKEEKIDYLLLLSGSALSAFFAGLLSRTQTEGGLFDSTARPILGVTPTRDRKILVLHDTAASLRRDLDLLASIRSSTHASFTRAVAFGLVATTQRITAPGAPVLVADIVEWFPHTPKPSSRRPRGTWDDPVSREKQREHKVMANDETPKQSVPPGSYTRETLPPPGADTEAFLRRVQARLTKERAKKSEDISPSRRIALGRPSRLIAIEPIRKGLGRLQP